MLAATDVVVAACLVLLLSLTLPFGRMARFQHHHDSVTITIISVNTVRQQTCFCGGCVGFFIMVLQYYYWYYYYYSYTTNAATRDLFQQGIQRNCCCCYCCCRCRQFVVLFTMMSLIKEVIVYEFD
jgi:hypothetical protein